MAINKYVGSRYVPLYCGVHDSSKAYEPLSIVSNAERNETFTSVQSVPAGIELTNETYWVQSGFTNAGMVIETDSAPVISTNESELVAERTTDGYLLTLSVANAFDCDGDVGEGLTLNTMYDVGRWQFEPSKCAGVPDEIKDLTTPAELVVTDYTIVGSDIMRQRQQITAYDEDNGAIFVRTHDGNNWSDWKMIGGFGGSFTLPIASASVLGGVKIGSGINVTEDGTISVNGGGTVAGEWIDVKNDISVTGNRADIKLAMLNEATGMLAIGFATQNITYSMAKVGNVNLTNMELFSFVNLNGNKWVAAFADSDSASTLYRYTASPVIYKAGETPAMGTAVFELTYSTRFTNIKMSEVDIYTANSSAKDAATSAYVLIPVKKVQ